MFALLPHALHPQVAELAAGAAALPHVPPGVEVPRVRTAPGTGSGRGPPPAGPAPLNKCATPVACPCLCPVSRARVGARSGGTRSDPAGRPVGSAAPAAEPRRCGGGGRTGTSGRKGGGPRCNGRAGTVRAARWPGLVLLVLCRPATARWAEPGAAPRPVPLAQHRPLRHRWLCRTQSRCAAAQLRPLASGLRTAVSTGAAPGARAGTWARFRSPLKPAGLCSGRSRVPTVEGRLGLALCASQCCAGPGPQPVTVPPAGAVRARCGRGAARCGCGAARMSWV